MQSGLQETFKIARSRLQTVLAECILRIGMIESTHC